MKPGRRPTPTHLKVLRGNPGQRALPTNEPEPDAPSNVPDPPDFVSGYAADEWYTVSEQLHRLGLLTVVDYPSLAAYCVAYGEWRTAREALARMASNDPIMKGLIIKSRYGDAVQNPLVTIARKAAGDMVRYASEFGFTPAARTRLATDFGGSAQPGKFAGLLAG